MMVRKRVVAVGMLVSVGVALGGGVAAQAAPDTTPAPGTDVSGEGLGSELVFGYTGHAEEVVVPAGATRAIVQVDGAGGGATHVYGYYGSEPLFRTEGGHGAVVQGQLEVTAGQLLTVGVGGRGGDSGGGNWNTAYKPGSAGWGVDPSDVGGVGGSVKKPEMEAGGKAGSGGGGASAIKLNGEAVVIAGGGGGAAASATGGNGGGAEGNNGNNGSGGAKAGQGGNATSQYDRTGSSTPDLSPDGGGGGGGGWHVGEGGNAGKKGTGSMKRGGAGGGGNSLTSGLTNPTVHPAPTDDNGRISITFIDHRILPAMTLSAPADQFHQGEPVTLTTHLPADATGYVGFYDEDQPGTDKGIGTAPIINGIATLTAPTKTLAPGQHRISASYGGDERYRANDTNKTTITITGPAVHLSASHTQVPRMGTIRLTATVPDNATGTITFTQKGTGRPLGTIPVTNGTAHITFTTSPTGPQEYTFTATYNGDNTYTHNTSNPITIHTT